MNKKYFILLVLSLLCSYSYDTYGTRGKQRAHPKREVTSTAAPYTRKKEARETWEHRTNDLLDSFGPLVSQLLDLTHRATTFDSTDSTSIKDPHSVDELFCKCIDTIADQGVHYTAPEYNLSPIEKKFIQTILSILKLLFDNLVKECSSKQLIEDTQWCGCCPPHLHVANIWKSHPTLLSRFGSMVKGVLHISSGTDSSFASTVATDPCSCKINGGIEEGSMTHEAWEHRTNDLLEIFVPLILQLLDLTHSATTFDLALRPTTEDPVPGIIEIGSQCTHILQEEWGAYYSSALNLSPIEKIFICTILNTLKTLYTNLVKECLSKQLIEEDTKDTTCSVTSPLYRVTNIWQTPPTTLWARMGDTAKRVLHTWLGAASSSESQIDG
jgi:hypothetical protein